jgi:hypothetical protein
MTPNRKAPLGICGVEGGPGCPKSGQPLVIPNLRDDSARLQAKTGLRSPHREWGVPSDAQLRWLLDRGVSVDTQQAATEQDEVIDLVTRCPSTGELGSIAGVGVPQRNSEIA